METQTVVTAVFVLLVLALVAALMFMDQKTHELKNEIVGLKSQMWSECEDCHHTWDRIQRKCTNCKPMQQRWRRARLAYFEYVINHYASRLAQRAQQQPGDAVPQFRIPQKVAKHLID